jgi:tRNA dimethylallyltransferase
MKPKEAQEVIFVVGPTAVGKTAYAIQLARKTDGEIVSADSMQVYIGMDIGTAKPTEAERRSVRHHMIDIADPRQDYSVGAYSKEARTVIEDILARGKLPIVCGGSGLYVHSLLYEMDFSGRERNEGLRVGLERDLKEKGPDYLFSKLLEADPAAADRVHPNNVKRVIRALERVYGDIENDGLREFDHTEKSPRLPGSAIIRLTLDREKLYESIERRAEAFFAAGLADEVRRLLKSGVPRNGTAMQGIGYKEVAAMLAGEIDENEALRLVKQNSRRYAKRQETWFKRYTDAKVITIEEEMR